MRQQLTDNLQKVNQEISDIRSKQTMMSTMDSKKEEEQRLLQESLRKPAQMFEELKGQWDSMMASQTETMKDLVNRTVNDALTRQKNFDSHEQRLGATDAQLEANQREMREWQQKVQRYEKDINIIIVDNTIIIIIVITIITNALSSS